MICVFDSGIGGLTAVKEIKAVLPDEELVYFGDTGRVPYGTRSRETIIKYALQDLRFLMSHKPRAVVAACGTVSTTAIDQLVSACDVPVVGVVEGASEAAAVATKNHRIAVVGTVATVRSGAFPARLKQLDPSVRVFQQPCPLLVPLVENGFTGEDNTVTREVCRIYLEPVAESGADTLILGCTHYPIISRVISDCLPGVTLINSGAAAADTLKRILPPPTQTDTHPGRVSYYVSDDPAGFTSSAELFLNEKISGEVIRIDIENY